MLEDPMFEPYSLHEVVRQDVHTRLVIGAVGLLPDEVDHLPIAHTLDIGCGTGTWLREMSYLYPRAVLVGTDPNPDMIKDATVRNRERGTIAFDVWDPLATGKEEEEAPFPAASFDLIRLNLASRWIRSQLSWLRILNTCHRFLKRRGALLIVENDGLATTSPALTRLDILMRDAHKITGRSLGGANYQGMTLALMALLKNAHFPRPKVVATAVDFSYIQEEENYAWRDYFRLLIQELTPYLTGAGVTTPEELCELSMRLDGEMFREDFCGLWTMFTLIARKI